MWCGWGMEPQPAPVQRMHTSMGVAPLSLASPRHCQGGPACLACCALPLHATPLPSTLLPRAPPTPAPQESGVLSQLRSTYITFEPAACKKAGYSEERSITMSQMCELAGGGCSLAL